MINIKDDLTIETAENYIEEVEFNDLLVNSVKLQLSEKSPHKLENDVEKAGDGCDDLILSSGMVEVQKGAEETEEEVYTTEVDDIGKVDRETFEETWENCSQDKVL